MSANLTTSALRDQDPYFRDAVRSAVVEKAINVLGGNLEDPVARNVLRDPEYAAMVFTKIAANDNTISADGWLFNDADIRNIVAGVWGPVGLIIPGLNA